MSPLFSDRLSSTANRYLGSLFKRPAVVAVALALVLCSCVAGDARFTAANLAGFWPGLWHGTISWITLIVSIFDSGVQIYERNNTGGWYDFGFMWGVSSAPGSLLSRWRSAHKAR